MTTQHNEWEFTEELPSLTKDTFKQWLSTLKKVLILHDLDNILDTDPLPATTVEKKKVASCQYRITKSFSEEVAKLLPAATYDLSPKDIVNTLRSRIHGPARTDPDVILLKAQSLSLSQFSSLNEFFDAHIQYQNQLIDVNAPGYSTTDVKATVKLILQCLSKDHRFSSVIPTLYLFGLPASVDDLRVRLLMYQHNTSSSGYTIIRSLHQTT